MKKFNRKFLSIFLTLAMVVTMIPAMSITASAEGTPDYLTFTGTEDFTLFIPKTSKWEWKTTYTNINAQWISGTMMEYSTDGENWANVTAAAYETRDWHPSSVVTVTSGGYVISSGAQKKIYLRGSGISSITGKYTPGDYHLEWELSPATENGTVAVSGNIMTLLDYSDPDNAVMGDYCFYGLFYDCSALTEAPELPANQLAKHCYESMFKGCSALTEAPELPVNQLADSCYKSMFEGCSSLTDAPELSANQLADSCYESMFEGCIALTDAPELPANQLAYNCYGGMFKGCSSLTEAPELSAMQLADTCYSYMFSGCTALTDAPELPAMQLADNCYCGMFDSCYSLKNAPDLPAVEVPYNSYNCMFCECIALQEPPVISAERLISSAEGERACEFLYMFEGCYSLRTAPEIGVVDLDDQTFTSLFLFCHSLQTVPQLNIDSMAGWGTMACMFMDCYLLKVEQATEEDYDWDFRDVDPTNDDDWLLEMIDNTANPELEITLGTQTSLYKVSSIQPAVKVSFDSAEVLFPDIDSAMTFVRDTASGYLLSDESVITVTLLKDVTYNMEIQQDENITLDLNGKVLKAPADSRVIKNDGTLTIKDSDAEKAPSEQSVHYFTYVKDGAWTYYGDTEPEGEYDIDTIDNINDDTDYVKVLGGCITGGNSLSDVGGGIANFGNLTFESGNVVGNNVPVGESSFGGGIANYNTFTMKKGNILGNFAQHGGGIYNAASSDFTMENGRIAFNTAKMYGGGVFVFQKSTFTMKKGSIDSCKNLAAKYGLGGGVMNVGTFTMDGGKIENCVAAECGGAVFTDGLESNNGFEPGNPDASTFNMNGGEIKNCAAPNHGAYNESVYIRHATMVMNGGKIQGMIFNNNNSTCKEDGTTPCEHTHVDCDIRLNEGLFSEKPKDSFIPATSKLIQNIKKSSCKDYPWQVKPVSKCTYDTDLTPGDSMMLVLDGETTGERFDIVKKCSGYQLKRGEQYLAYDGNEIGLQDAEYTWKYDGGLYAETKTTCKTGFRFWCKPVIKTVKQYLSYDEGEFTLSDCRVCAEVQVTADEHTCKYLHNGDGFHEAVCIKCGYEAGPEEHEYDETTHLCKCGKIDPKECCVSDVEVTEKQIKKTVGFLFRKKTIIAYQYTICPETQNVGVCEVKYSANQENWNTGTVFNSDVKLSKFYIEVTDSNGKVTDWIWDGTTTVPAN